MYDWHISGFDEDCERAKTSVRACDRRKQYLLVDGGQD